MTWEEVGGGGQFLVKLSWPHLQMFPKEFLIQQIAQAVILFLTFSF